MTGFFSRKAKNREKLLRNERSRFGEEKRFKVIGEKVLTHEAYALLKFAIASVIFNISMVWLVKNKNLQTLVHLYAKFS